jgi:hypothetical protein
MASLALKAIAYGAERIPDRVFEAIPGGYFTPQEKKDIKKQRKKRADKHRDSSGGRRSHRPHTPLDEFSDYSPSEDSDGYDDRGQRRRSRRHSLSGRSGDKRQSKQEQKEREWEEMERAERGEPEMSYSPPPTSESYTPPRPYNPADYAPAGAAAAAGAAVANEYYDRQASSAGHEYQYPAQVNTPFMCNPPLNAVSYPSSKYPKEEISYPSCSSPLNLVLYSSFEPPFALWYQQPNSPQPYAPSPTVRPTTANSATAARYTPAGHSPPNSATYTPVNTGYALYNPADYASPSQTGGPYAAPRSTYASPPPFYRQPSHSQPSLNQYAYPPNNQLVYQGSPSRYDSTRSSHRHKHHGDGHTLRHRTRSVGGGRSRSRMTDQVRDRLDRLNLDETDKKLAAGAVGALAGGLAGNQVGHGTLSTLVGAAIGGLGGSELEKRHEK